MMAGGRCATFLLGMLAAGEAFAAELGDAKPLPEQLGVLDPDQAYPDRFLDAERSCVPMVLTDDYGMVVVRTCFAPADPRFPTGGPWEDSRPAVTTERPATRAKSPEAERRRPDAAQGARFRRPRRP
jgi:hypothetical protein